MKNLGRIPYPGREAVQRELSFKVRVFRGACHLGALTAIFLWGTYRAAAQTQEVPEAVFLNFSTPAPYVPAYHGRDPFKPLDNVDRSLQLSILELDYRGVMLFNEVPVALFTWRGNPSVRYTLKFRSLRGGSDKSVDGVVGEITPSQVVLTQGGRKIVYPRK